MRAWEQRQYEASPLRHTDVAWLAIDRDDHVAWLTTFGHAVVPSWLDLVQVPTFLALEDELKGLTRTPDKFLLWEPVARFGIFAYDWCERSDAYVLLGRPSSPLHVTDLPQRLAATAAKSRLAHRCFSASDQLSVQDVMNCVG
jgi:hypothetical protein